MAEIKSTIDLVMERTRNLTMSEEDKREQATAEFRATSNRLIQKYMDREIDVDRFLDEFRRIENKHGLPAKRVAAVEIVKRIDPTGDNRPLLDLLKSGLDVNVSGIEGILNDFSKAVDSEDRETIIRLEKDLLERGISGSAVLPNLAADNGWIQRRQEISERFMGELASAAALLG